MEVRNKPMILDRASQQVTLIFSSGYAVYIAAERIILWNYFLGFSNVLPAFSDETDVVNHPIGGIMHIIHSCLSNVRARRVAVRLMQTAALAMIVLLASQALAASNREVQSRVAPVYPELAKRMKITGIVEVEATVDPDGKVIGAKAISGSTVLSPAAAEAVRHWKFAPGAEQSTVDVHVNFALGG
jgi:TonB family protein